MRIFLQNWKKKKGLCHADNLAWKSKATQFTLEELERLLEDGEKQKGISAEIAFDTIRQMHSLA